MDLRVLLSVAIVALAGCEKPTTGDNASVVEEAGKARAASEANGPFGIAMGQKLSDLKLKPLGDGAMFAEVASVPAPHSDFGQVGVHGFEGVGVCAIKGVGRTIVGDGAGKGVQSKIDTLSKALETKYGKPKLIDACGGGEVMCESQFWMMSLQNGERAYGYRWEGEALKKHKLASISLYAAAASINDSFAVIEYESADRAACEAAAAKGSAKGL